MPADPSGVTTDDQSPRGNEADDHSPVSTDGRTATSATSPGADRRGESVGDGSPSAGDTSGATPAPGPAPADGARGTDPAPDPGAGPTGRDADGPGDSRTGSAGSIEDPGAAAWPDPVPETATQTTTVDPDLVPDGLAGGEPPPAPVLAGGPSGPGGRRREGRGRHASGRTDRASRRGLRVNQRLWSIDPWSVFKVSALFYLCLGLIVLVAGTLLYNAGRRVGTIDQAESFVTRMGAYGECVAKADVEKGAEFEEDDDKCEEGQVLVGGFALDDGTLFRVAAIGGVVLVVAGSIGNVLLTVLLNLLNELTGGLRHTVVKEPVARQPGNRSARSPNPRRRAPTGSPARRPQG
jgi:Transmembrane domain of unknown function (DUF3566)